MIYTSHPKPRLRDKQIGDSVRLKGVDLNSAFFLSPPFCRMDTF